MFKDTYKNKRVLINGHTGFKGSWLTLWLKKLGADVVGFSDCVPTQPSLFGSANLSSKITHIYGDVTDYEALSGVVNDIKPDFIFHMAAQAIVSESYLNPLKTINTNVIGVANILEAIKDLKSECVAIIITSDKCYENIEWLWGYKETDQIGGRDIYSGSKGAAENIFHSYFHSFFVNKSNIKISTGRAGNVIGGGDWAKDRIVVDCMKNWSQKKPVDIRCPDATRPWQHVLEPLSGYLSLGLALKENPSLSGESFNFGPLPEKSRTVVELLNDLAEKSHLVKDFNAYSITNNIPFHEAGLLRLNCEKALFRLKWEATLNYNECVEMVAEWYFNYFQTKGNIFDFTLDQIKKYEMLALNRGRNWAK